MAIKSRVRTLTANPVGLARWLEREAETMHPLQFFREALQNEIEAGADRVIIDGFEFQERPADQGQRQRHRHDAGEAHQSLGYGHDHR